MAQLKFIPIVPKKAIGLLTLSREMRAEMKKETEEIEKLFRNVSDGFDNTDVSYEKNVSVVGDDLTGATFTDNEIMGYLNDGTDERWAVMSSDWSSKTARGRLSSTSGSGRVVRRGKRNMTRPRPGIEPRQFDKAIVKVRRKPFRRNMQLAIRKAQA